MNKQEYIKLEIEIFNKENPKLSNSNTLNQHAASIFIGCSPNTLKNYRSEGIGPKYSQPDGEGSRVYYTKVSLASWLIETETMTA